MVAYGFSTVYIYAFDGGLDWYFATIFKVEENIWTQEMLNRYLIGGKNGRSGNRIR